MNIEIIERSNNVLHEIGLYDEDDYIQETLLENIDSYMFIQMIVRLEEEFDIGIPDEYLLMKHFRTRDGIHNIICDALDLCS